MALQGDGNGVVTIPSASTTGGFSVVFSSVTLSGGTEIIIGDNSANNQFVAIFTGSEVGARVDGFNITPNYDGALGEIVKVELTRAGNDVTMLVDDVITGSISVDPGTTFSLDAFFAYNSGTLIGTMLLSGTCSMVGFGAERSYDFNGTGSTLVDTISGQNGTLSGFNTGGFTPQTPSDTISITSVVDDQSIKRDISNQATFTIAGDIVGTATSVEYQLDSGSWLTLDAAPTTTFSGTVVVTDEQDVSVRYSNNIAVTDTVLRLKAALVIAIGPAQSNGLSRLFSTQPLSVTAGKPTPSMYKEGVFSAMEDPTSFDPSVTNGSIWIHVAKAYSDAGVPVCFANVAVPGTMLSVWQPLSVNHNRIVDAGNGLGGISILMTLIGESDASAGTSKTTFKSEYLSAVSDINTAFNCPVYAVYFPVGANTGTTPNVNTIRLAYDELISENAYINDGGDLAVIDISVAADPAVNDDLHIRNDTDAVTAGNIIYAALLAVYSDLNMTGTGTPDGSYSMVAWDLSDNSAVFNGNVTFLNGDATINLPVIIGADVLAFTPGANSPVTGIAYDGVTE